MASGLMALIVNDRPTLIRRPLVVGLTGILSFLLGAAGVELIVWAPFRYSPVFQPARAVTAQWCLDLHLHSLDLWGIACLLPAPFLWLIFTRRGWVVGWAAAGLGAFDLVFFAWTFFKSVDTRPPTHAVPPEPHPGLFVATFVSAAALVFLVIFVAVFVEHRTLWKRSG